MYTKELNKIALSSDDDKRLQAFDRITTYPYGANEMMIKKVRMKRPTTTIDINDKF